jgi:hypothetical protein
MMHCRCRRRQSHPRTAIPERKVCQDPCNDLSLPNNNMQSFCAYTRVALPNYASDSEHEPPHRVLTPPTLWLADEAEAHPPILLYMCGAQLCSLVVAEQQLIEHLQMTAHGHQSLPNNTASHTAVMCGSDAAHQSHNDGAPCDSQSLPWILQSSNCSVSLACSMPRP